ncbi:hypothetical protein PTSG_13193 [Salpingoeca rosetta]|uniref:Secreted protein n=1 Tax=Salpingoeca rosetta (strain ATCC 50818 / BSB-021) TaxID=946362 RepID=F2UTB4_SALR5|nr:uncharacterized protein PTSG_13193 [Salpingoeca rosetta]EGD81870.1 hypothetical protein PTSG_13193 [Salpingoeca rosetta]|eukprot:XP_004987590.1 hypothetical protein PTSG_13193 [Salpingoeca rosetta]
MPMTHRSTPTTMVCVVTTLLLLFAVFVPMQHANARPVAHRRHASPLQRQPMHSTRAEMGADPIPSAQAGEHVRRSSAVEDNNQYLLCNNAVHTLRAVESQLHTDHEALAQEDSVRNAPTPEGVNLTHLERIVQLFCEPDAQDEFKQDTQEGFHDTSNFRPSSATGVFDRHSLRHQDRASPPASPAGARTKVQRSRSRPREKQGTPHSLLTLDRRSRLR